MIYIGNHVSVSKGYLSMGKHESNLGGNTFAFFPRNPRGGRSKAVSSEDVGALRQFISENAFGALVVHGAYTMNVCAAKEEVRANSLEMLRDDLLRLQELPDNFYNFHPGCHVGQGKKLEYNKLPKHWLPSLKSLRGRAADLSKTESYWKR